MAEKRRRALVVALSLTIASCGPAGGPTPAQSSKAPPPATVSRAMKEEDLATITLAAEAESRLGIVLEPARRIRVERAIERRGEVVVPDGATSQIVAPFAGTVEAPPGGSLPKPGATIAANAALSSLAPLLPPERTVMTPAERVSAGQAKSNLTVAKSEAQSDVDRATVEVTAAQVALTRAEKLAAEDAGSARSLDEAKASVQKAEATLRAAKKREEALRGTTLDDPGQNPSKITVSAPRAGLVRNVRVAPGQVVPAGSALFDIVSLDTVWIRVPIYAGEVRQLLPEREARIAQFGGDRAAASRPVKSIKAPPTADALANTVDLYFEADNGAGDLRPGESVVVSIATRTPADTLVTPSSAILYDVNGGTWVYVNVAPRVFKPRRVIVRDVTGTLASIDRGLEPGDSIVVAGAAELFGTQFGHGK